MIIEPMLPGDWPDVVRIFAEGLATGVASFETDLPTWERWNAAHFLDGRLVARLNAAEQAAGWAALSPISARKCYAGVAEVSVYVAAKARGQGVGNALLGELIRCSESMGLWTLQAVIFAVNEPSLRLHQNAGFRVVGRRERIAQRDGVWHDTILLERRSLSKGD
jgi:L-amino acid N-acyltransferase YncA